MRQMLLLLVPCAALMMVLSEPITRIIYQRGEFDAAQTDLVSEALFFFSLSLPFAGREPDPDQDVLQPPAARGRPTQIALGNLGVNAGLDALLYEPMGIGGITLATAIVSLITTSRWRSCCAGGSAASTWPARSMPACGCFVAGALCAAVAFGVREALGGLERQPARPDRAGGRRVGRRPGRLRRGGDWHCGWRRRARSAALIRGQLARLR